MEPTRTSSPLATGPTWRVVADAGAVSGTPVPFAANRLVVVTPPGNPKHLTSFADLAAPGVRVAVCGDQGPCGPTTQLVRTADRRVQLHPANTEAYAKSRPERRDDRDRRRRRRLHDRRAGRRRQRHVVSASEDADAVTSWITVVKGTDQERGASASSSKRSPAPAASRFSRTTVSRPRRRTRRADSVPALKVRFRRRRHAVDVQPYLRTHPVALRSRGHCRAWYRPECARCQHSGEGRQPRHDPEICDVFPSIRMCTRPH